VKIILNLSLFLACIFVACKKDESLWQVKNLNPNNKTLAFGHGGMGIKYRYPMNSMESLHEVLSIGADGTEMDIQMTKDKVLVLFHNSKLEDATNGNGLVRDKNWTEIKNLEYKWPFLNKTKLIRLEDFFKNQPINTNHIFTFDCKVEAAEEVEYRKNFVEKLYGFIDLYHLQKNCFIESYNVEFLSELALKDSTLKLFVHPENYSDGLAISKQIKLYGLTLDRLKINSAEIEQAHQNNLHISLYNLTNSKENTEAIQMNADFLQGDAMDDLINQLK